MGLYQGADKLNSPLSIVSTSTAQIIYPSISENYGSKKEGSGP